MLKNIDCLVLTVKNHIVIVTIFFTHHWPRFGTQNIAYWLGEVLWDDTIKELYSKG